MSRLAAKGRPATARLPFVLVAMMLCALGAGTSPGQESVLRLPASEDLPSSPIERAQKEGKALPLSLKDLTKLALQNNLDIAISDTNEEIYQHRVLQAYGPYDPLVSATLGVQSTKSPSTNQTNRAAGSFSKTDFAQWNFQFAQNIPTGGAITAFYNSSRTETNQLFSLFSPQYDARTQIQVTQPLRRNFGVDQYRSTIKLANLDIKVNDSQFKQKVTDTVSRIQALYWDLVGTIEDYEIRRKSVGLAQITLQNNKKKVEIGTLAPIGITEAQAELASREVDLLTAEEKINNVENGLRGLISNDRHAEIWQKVIVPTDTPEFKEFTVELDSAIDTALQNRPELEQLAVKLQQNEISYDLDSNQKRWQVDLVGRFGSQGVAGPPGIDPFTGLPRIPDPDFVGGVGKAYRNVFTGGFTNWFLGLNIQIPLRNRNLDAQLGQLQVQKRQNLMNQKVVEQQIVVEIRNAVQALETRKKQVETSRVARLLAREQLEGEEKRFQAGLSENFRVLDRQRGLAAAAGVEVQAMIAYKKAVIDLQKAMYTLLESNEFEIAKTSSDTGVAKLK